MSVGGDGFSGCRDSAPPQPLWSYIEQYIIRKMIFCHVCWQIIGFQISPLSSKKSNYFDFSTLKCLNRRDVTFQLKISQFNVNISKTVVSTAFWQLKEVGISIKHVSLIWFSAVESDTNPESESAVLAGVEVGVDKQVLARVGVDKIWPTSTLAEVSEYFAVFIFETVALLDKNYLLVNVRFGRSKV